MTEQNNELLTQLTALLGQVQASSGWNSANALDVLGVAIPIKVTTPRGDCRCYLSLPAAVAQTPESLLNALQELDRRGYPLDIWQGATGWNSVKGSYRRKGGW
jgi:hypothetical protein